MKRIGQALLIGIFSLFDGFCLGGIVGSFFVPKPAGLTGGAIVFWYAMLGGIISLIAAILIMRTTKGIKRWKILLITGLFAFVFLVIGLIRAWMKQGGA